MVRRKDIVGSWAYLSLFNIIDINSVVQMPNLVSSVRLIELSSSVKYQCIENNACTWVTAQRSQEGYFAVYIITKNSTRVSAETVRYESTYIILFLTRQKESINDDKKNLCTSSPCLTRSVFVLLMTSQSIVDDVTITRQLWRDNVISYI